MRQREHTLVCFFSKKGSFMKSNYTWFIRLDQYSVLGFLCNVQTPTSQRSTSSTGIVIHKSTSDFVSFTTAFPFSLFHILFFIVELSRYYAMPRQYQHWMLNCSRPPICSDTWSWYRRRWENPTHQYVWNLVNSGKAWATNSRANPFRRCYLFHKAQLT